MALAKGGIIPTISGKLAGTEFAVTKNGLVVKRQKPPKIHSSRRFIRFQNMLAKANSAWNSMTPEQIKAWNVISSTIRRRNRLKVSMYLSPRALFISNLIDYSLSPSTPYETTPPTAIIDAPIYNSISFTAGGPYTIDTSLKLPIDNRQITVWVARWQSKSRTHKPRTWIRIGTKLSIFLPDNWYSKFQSENQELVQGEHIAIKILFFKPDRWRSPLVTDFTTVL